VSETRKLAAILVSDVVGYSLLTGADEDRILARLRALRSDLIDPTISVHHGHVVKRTGDGAIVEFRSVVDAVNCAIEIQRAMVERNAEVAPDKRIEFRIGIHVGDVVEESDGDLMGDGVNIAARLQAIAKPGDICLSEDAYRHVKGRLALSVADLGPMQLKHIAEPVRIYSLQIGVQENKAANALARSKKPSLHALLIAAIVGIVAVAGGAWLLIAPNRTTMLASSAPATSEVPHLSIMVLPFKNLSSDSGYDRLADSLTDNLTSDLSRMAKSFVVARSTAFTFKDKPVDAKEIGSKFNIRYLLEGSLQREQDRTSVNAQLIDAQSGAHLWADRFEENASNSFELQDRILAHLIVALRRQLVIAEADKGERAKNPDAIDLTMRGRALIQGPQRPNKERNDAAIAFFEQALNVAPNEPDVLANLALAYARNNSWKWAGANEDYWPKIISLTNRALELDPDNVTAYVALAFHMDLLNRPNDILRAANAGLAIDRYSAALYAARSFAEGQIGRYAENISDQKRAKELNRYDPEVLWWASP
jgi:adenylate cyclase